MCASNAESSPAPQTAATTASAGKGVTGVGAWEWTGWVFVTLALVPIAWALLFTIYMPYDDEGYVLWSLRHVAQGHALYGEVYSQYGPFFHEFYRVLGWLGYPFTNDSARIVTGICWLATSLFAGLIVRLLAASPALGWATQICVFILLWKCCREPGHPGGLLALLVAFSACFGVGLIQRQRLGAFAIIQGALVVALGLSKINQGVFQLIAVVTWWPFVWPKGVSAATRRGALLALVVAAGTGLMLALLDKAAIQLHLAVFISGTCALVLTKPKETLTLTPFRFWALGLLGALVVAVFSFGGAWLNGSSVADLIHYTFWEPIRHPGVYRHLVNWSPWFAAWCTLTVVAAVTWIYAAVRLRMGVLLIGKGAAVALLAHACWHATSSNLDVTWFMLGPALAWVLALPLRQGLPTPLRHARWWVAWLFCWQWLQAYPVAGTQTAWGAFLALPLVFLGIGDLITFWHRPRLVILPLLLACGTLATVASYALHQWRTTEPLDLPEARLLRVTPTEAAGYRHLAKVVRANGDVLFTYPGTASLNSWFEMPAPALAHATHWFSLLDDARQHQIISGLEMAEAPVVIVHREHVLYLIKEGQGPQGLLKDYLQTSFRPAMRVGPHDLWIRREKHLIPLSTARLLQVGDTPGVVFFTRIKPESINSIELKWADLPGERGVVVASAGGWRALPLPGEFSNLTSHDGAPLPVRYFMPVEDTHLWSSPRVKILCLLNAEGRVLDRLRFDDLGIPDTTFTAAPPPQ